MISDDPAVRAAIAEMEQNGCRVAIAPDRITVRLPGSSVQHFAYGRDHVLDCLERLRERGGWRSVQYANCTCGTPPSRRDGGTDRDAEVVASLRRKLQKAEERARLAVQQCEAWRHQAELAEEELAALRDDGSSSASVPDEAFRRAKKAFAQLYHPDLVISDGIERVVRAEVFKEFWAVLEAIENGQR